MRLRRLTVSLAFLMLLPAPGSAAAQTDSRSGKWSGNLDVSTGLGIHFLKDEGAVTDTLFHLREQVALQVAYTTPTFSVSTQAQGSFVKNETRTIRTTFKEEREMELIGRGSQFIQPGSSVRSNFSWRPSPKNQYTAFLAYQYGYDHTNNLTSTIAADTATNFRIQASDEKRRFHQYSANAGWRSSHQLGSPRLTLLTAGEWKNVAVNKQSLWSKALFSVQQDKDENYMIVYRLTPRTNSNDGMTSISLRDTLLSGTHSLTVEPGVRFRYTETRDENSGATQVSENVWRDSTRLHEDFRFVTLQLDPLLRMEYRYKSLRAYADYSLQVYGRQLTSHLNYQKLEWKPLLVIGRSFLEWMPSPSHQLVLGNTLSVTRPTYLQTCWYDRQGDDPSQLFQGNPALRPTRTISTDLTWRFRAGNFRLMANTAYDFRQSEIEQLFYEEEIDGKLYRVFTWFNTAYGHTFTERMQLGWNGRFFSSNLQVNYQQRQQVSDMSDTRKKSNYWELMADVSARPGSGWTISASGSYKGDIQTLYSLTKKYYTVNGLVRKDFRRFSLYLEGRDLLDKPVITSFYSQDHKVQWEETVRQNRRIFILGFNWRF